MSELVYTLIFGSYGFTLLTTRFLNGRIEKAASAADMARIEAKVDQIYDYLLTGKITTKPADSSKC